MRTRTKAALTVLCALLLVVATFLGTLAYLTSQTGEVKNTFTVGKVAIKLDETVTDTKGDAVTPAAKTETGNALHLIPGSNYTKDPTVHVLADSEACWVFVKVADELTAIQADTTVADQIADNGWTALDGETGVYYINVSASEAKTGKDLPVFGTLTIKGDVTGEALVAYAEKKITVQAYAIQSENLTNVSDAWTALGVA